MSKSRGAVPAYWYGDAAVPLGARLLSTVYAAISGLRRGLYARGYIADPAARGTGFLTGFAATVVLLLGGLLGALFA